jgi:hypothetical protein
MSPEQMKEIDTLLQFLDQQRFIGKTTKNKITASKTFDAMKTLVNEYNLLLTHVNTCPVAAAEINRGNNSDESEQRPTPS